MNGNFYIPSIIFRKKKLEHLFNRLQNIRESQEQYVCGNEIKLIEGQIDEILLEEEIYWRQRSRAVWLQERDKNTRFFHLKASNRKKKNTIEGLLNENSKWITEAEEVESLFCEHFAKLFTSTHPSYGQLENALRDMPKKVTEDMNEQLNQPFSEDEIVAALNQMHPTKTPGPDGLPAVFFQKHWNAVSERVISTCMHILNDGGNIAPLNHTYIALIPKITKPKRVVDFRPISLCNVIYRIIAKAIANRLKQILHFVISQTQSAFIPSRLITDNIIIGYECLHKIRHGKGKNGGW